MQAKLLSLEVPSEQEVHIIVLHAVQPDPNNYVQLTAVHLKSFELRTNPSAHAVHLTIYEI